jgi:hypothetical protein
MKNNNDLFSEKMPSDLKNKILASSADLLKLNQQKQRRTFFMWIGSGLAAMSASYVFFRLPKNKESELNTDDIAQNFEIYDNIESDEDIEVLADLEFLEDFDVIEQMDEES